MAQRMARSAAHGVTRFAARRISAKALTGYLAPPGGTWGYEIKNTPALSALGREIPCVGCHGKKRVPFGKNHFGTLHKGGDAYDFEEAGTTASTLCREKPDDQNGCKGKSGQVNEATTDIVQLNEEGTPLPGDASDVITTDGMKNEAAAEQGRDKTTKEYMVLMFTCKICEKKSAKKFSKQAYNNGVVIIRCPSCEKLHLVSDQLGWFQEGKTNIEDILKQKGESVIRKFSYNNLLEIDDLLNAYK
ncbi:unnamed protein product [Plasmodium vivax]|uniref:(malaria parasite P. vivax) hypothetical protein n=1 Tax=Plasmodium vivax TaxID=5855 RepID=A0A8S4HAY2_PLAVI|nr:unnamed protein product [Plasmodium vivax]